MRMFTPVILKTFRIGLPAILCLIVGVGGAWTPVAQAQSGGQLSLFRDAEIEDTIRIYATPLFEVAGLNPESIEIHLVDQNVLNAFVANGRHMFLFSGLLMESEDPNLIIGVIGHETGHLAGGHLVLVRNAFENSSAMVILSAVLGVAVGLAGSPGGGAAILASGPQIAQRNFFAYTRVQESAADQAAMRYLDETGQSVVGLRDLMETLSESELLLSSSSEIPYFLTHPLSSDRVQALNAHLETSPYATTTSSPELIDLQKRMVAKLYGFLTLPRTTYLRYPNRDADLYSRYAWAIAKYRERLMDEALALTDGLIAEEPDNPYFHELRGQMLFETGQIEAALPSYYRSVELAPDKALLRIGLAQTLLQLKDTASWEEARLQLEEARRIEPEYPTVWFLLGDVYGKLDMMPQSNVSRAEWHFLRGDLVTARSFAERAIQALDYGSPDWFRADDIIAAADSVPAP
jgi:predicted Zn-dependent protease